MSANASIADYRLSTHFSFLRGGFMAVVREMSETSYYHITVRGVGQMPIFEDDVDRLFYLKLLRKISAEERTRIIAWALMGNHVHLVIDMMRDEMPTRLMRRLDTTYAMYFQRKTDHVGHVFQGDFWSGPIVTDEQLLATVDYVHRNPERARISSREEYRWSSYREYVGESWITDTRTVLELFGSVGAFVAYRGTSDCVVRHIRRVSIDDAQALQLALEAVGVQTADELRASGELGLKEACVSLREAGISERQTSRVLGVGRKLVHRLLNERTRGSDPLVR